MAKASYVGLTDDDCDQRWIYHRAVSARRSPRGTDFASGSSVELAPTVIGYTETVSMSLVTEEEIRSAVASMMDLIELPD